MELDKRVERHDQEATEHTEPEEIEGVGRDRIQAGQDAQCQADADRSDRDQTRLDVGAGHPAGHQGAEDDADTRAGEQTLDDDRVVDGHRLLGE